MNSAGHMSRLRVLVLGIALLSFLGRDAHAMPPSPPKEYFRISTPFGRMGVFGARPQFDPPHSTVLAAERRLVVLPIRPEVFFFCVALALYGLICTFHEVVSWCRGFRSPENAVRSEPANLLETVRP